MKKKKNNIERTRISDEKMRRMWLGLEIVVAGLPPLGHVRSHTKFGPNRFSRFDVYWIQTILYMCLSVSVNL